MVAGTLQRPSRLFGSRLRSSTLIALRLLEESYPSELARFLSSSVHSIQRIVESLESEGVLVGRPFGRTRRISFNPRYVAHDELRALLWKLGEHDIDLQRALARKRGRPRRAGKPGL